MAKRKAVITIYPDAKGEWRWNLKHGNGKVIADSGEGYVTKGGAEKAVDRVCKALAESPRIDVRTGTTA